MGEAVGEDCMSYIISNDRVTHRLCEVTVARRIVYSRKMTSSIHFIVVSTTQSLTTQCST